MKTETDAALRDAIKVASDTNDLMMVAVLCHVRAICLLDGERELAEKLSGKMSNRPFSPDLWTIDRVIENLNRGEDDAIPRALTWMKDKGSSVILSWGDDNNQWACSWATGGNPYTCAHENMTAAIVGALLKVKHRGENEAKPYYVTDMHGNRLRHG